MKPQKFLQLLTLHVRHREERIAAHSSMTVWTSEDMNLLAVPLGDEAHQCFPAGVLHLKLQEPYDSRVFLKRK
jgi:hypothetical protein